MNRVAVRVFHVDAGRDAGPLERRLAAVRATLGERLVARFVDVGARDASIVAGPADDTPFGRRLSGLVVAGRPDGLVVAGSGALGLSEPGDLLRFLDAAGSTRRVALANNRFSADAVAISCAEILEGLPDLPGDNALPRWLAEVGGYEVRDLHGRRRLQVDVDGPLDALLIGAAWPEPTDTQVVHERLAQVAAVAADHRAEVVVAGRTSGTTLRWLVRGTAARTRAIVEERGLRAAAAAARGDGRPNARPPRSIVGAVLDRDGPEALGPLMASLGDAAIVDARVLIAHRLGPDERSWPRLEDRLASDLLLPERIADPWLRALTASAATAPIPVVLGGHTVVGPGLPLVLGSRR